MLGECLLWTGKEERENSEEHVAQSWANWTVEGLLVPLSLPSSERLLHLIGGDLHARVVSRSPPVSGTQAFPCRGPCRLSDCYKSAPKSAPEFTGMARHEIPGQNERT